MLRQHGKNGKDIPFYERSCGITTRPVVDDLWRYGRTLSLQTFNSDFGRTYFNLGGPLDHRHSL